MKKFFIIVMVCICGCLNAQNLEVKVGDTVCILRVKKMFKIESIDSKYVILSGNKYPYSAFVEDINSNQIIYGKTLKNYKDSINNLIDNNNKDLKSPYGFAYIAEYGQNSVGGVSPCIAWRCNNPNLKIKYIMFGIACYNKVGDKINTAYPSNTKNNYWKFAVGETKYFRCSGEVVYYNESVYEVKLAWCKVQTYDGKWHKIPINIKPTINGEDISQLIASLN